VLTAAHCLYNARTKRYFAASALTFLIGFTGGAFEGSSPGSEVLIAPDFDASRPDVSPGSDWALVTLHGQAGEERILPPLAELPAPGTPVMMGGYGQDNPLVLTADPMCRILGHATDARRHSVLHHDCTSVHGVSGAPILARDVRGRWAIAGVNVARIKGQAIGLATSVQNVPWPSER
jgi:protease YdgD